MNVARQRRARLLVGLAVLVAGHLLLRGYVTDDTYIHLRYAENLAQRGEFAFNPGDHTYGATSPLWIFGLTGLLKLGLAGEAAAWTLGLLAGALAVALWAGLIERLPFPPAWKWWLFVLGLADAWFLRWTMSGMETPLAVAALLALLWPLDLRWRPALTGAHTHAALWRRYLAWGVAAGLAALVRPEFILLAPLALPWLLWVEYRRADDLAGGSGRHQARPHGPALAALVGWILAAGPWLIYAKATFGRFMPGTAAAKSQAITWNIAELIGYVARAIQPLATTQGVLWLFVLAVVALVITGRCEDEDEDEDEGAEFRDWSLWQAMALAGIPLTWTVAAVAGYAVTKVWIISRYVVPLAMPLLLAIGVATFWLLYGAGRFRGRGVTRRWIGPAAAVLAVAVNAAILVGLVRPHARHFSAGVRECYVQLGQWLGHNSPPDAVVAALDIGALAYGSDLRVLDLMGLVSPQIMAIGRREGFQAMVESGSWLRAGGQPPPQWFVDRTDGPPRWDGRTVDGVDFGLVETCVIRGVGLREGQDWTVALYRLTQSAGPLP